MTANEAYFTARSYDVPQTDVALTLDSVATFIRRFVVLSDDQLVACGLWVAHTWAIDAADATPYLAVTSAEKRSGKTRLLEVLELVVHSPLPTANISDAALFRAIGQMQPTILLDEVDAIFGAKARDREDLRGMLNAGYRRGAVARRMGGAKMTTLEAFPVFCAKAFAGIGECLPDTIVDRSIPIRLQRRMRSETVDRFRRRDVEASAVFLRDGVADWLQPQLDHLRGLRPFLPDELDDRAQDVWEPLLAIAELGGDVWVQRARSAALALSAGVEREDDSLTARLLADISTAFDDSGEEKLRTSDLIDRLAAIEESPWGDWYGKTISAQSLSKLLRPHRVKTMEVWIDGAKARGYKAEQFADAFARVLGGRPGRGGRTVSSVGIAPTTSTAPTVLHTVDLARACRFDQMYPPRHRDRRRRDE